MVDGDRLAAAPGLLDPLDVMAPLPQAVGHGVADPVLDADDPLLEESPGEIDRLLRVHAVDVAVEDHRGMAGGLVVAAHDAERHDQPSVAAQHRRNDRVQGPLPRPGLVRMALDQAESGAAVLQEDGISVGGEAAAEAPIGRVDERDRHPVAVHDGDIDGVPMNRLDRAARDGQGPPRVDERRKPPRRLVRQQVIEPRRVVRVGDEPVARVIGELCRLGLDVRALGAEGIEPRKVEAPEDVQHQKRGRTLAVRRMLKHLMPQERAGHRAAVVAARRGEIVVGVAPSGGAQAGDHVLGHRPLVEPRAAVPGDEAQRLGMGGAAEQIARDGCLAGGKEMPPARALQPACAFRPVERDARRDRDAFLGIADGRGETVGEPEPAVILRQAAERVDGARHGDGIDAFGADGGVAPVAQRGGRQPGRGAAGPVQGDDLLAPGGFQQDEAIAANAAGLRLGEAEQHRPGDGRIDGIAAAFEDVDGRLRGQRMRGRAEPVDRKDLGPSRKLKVAHRIPLSGRR